MKLSDKQQRFVDEYCIDRNATQAYKRAGYKGTGRTAENNASRLLGNAGVRAAIDARLAELAKETRMTAEESWREIGYIARHNVKDLFDKDGRYLKPHQLPDRTAKALKGVKIKRYTEGHGDDAREVEVTEYLFGDKLAANALNLRGLGELKERKEVSGPGGGPIPVHHSGNISHEPSLEASDAAFAESIALAATGEDSAASAGVPEDGRPESVGQDGDAGVGLEPEGNPPS